MPRVCRHAAAWIAFMILTADTSLASTCAYHWPWAEPQSFVFPAEMFLLNVKNASLPNGGARGDGTTDDWLAIQTAFNQSSGYQIIYFPAGVYLISQPLAFPRNHAGVTSRRILYGESVLNTCIRVSDGNPLFGNVSSPKAVIRLGEGVAQNFFNGIHSITVSTGAGNPGGVGVQFDANNMGSVRNVSIVSEDGGGVRGLDMQYSDQIGPLLIKWLHVDGFDTGVATATNVDSETLEHVWLTNQRTAAFSNTGQVVSIRDMTVTVTQATCTPVVQTSGEPNDAFLTLVQSNLINSVADVVLQTAISITSSMAHLRDVATSGFNFSLMYVGAATPPPPPPTPTSCVNTTLFSDVAGNGPLIAQIGGGTLEECCITCLETRGGGRFGGAQGACVLWTFQAGATNASNLCWLHNDTSTYPRVNRTSGVVNITLEAVPPAPGTGSVNVSTPYISEWVSHTIVKLWDDGSTPDASLNLTVVETPEPQLPDPSQWVNGLGIPINGSYYNCTKHEDKHNGTSTFDPDCSPLLQTALNDPSAGTVFFPEMTNYPGTWYFYANISIPRTVSHIMATSAQLAGPAFWTIDDGDENDPPLIIERLTGTYGPQITILHASRRTVVLKDVSGVIFMADCSTPGGLGNVFIDDGVFPPINFCGGQHVWARQLNTESAEMDVSVSGGATLWVLGHKIERGLGGLINVTDATVEVLGTFAYSTDRSPQTAPLYTITNSSASVSLREYNANCVPFQSLAAETRDGVTHTLSNNFSIPGIIPGHDCSNGTRGSGFTLLNAYSAAAAARSL